jgi:predicted  nucleic acid-binding Zn-ribbon protein
MNSLRDADVKEREGLLAQRKELAAALTPSVLETYERVRKGRKGIAVAEVRDGFCTACNVRLRPQVYNEIRVNQTLRTCESCSRIIYCVEPPIAVNDDIQNAANGTDQGATGG